MANKALRLTITVLTTAMIGFFGWFAADAAIRWITGSGDDPQGAALFSKLWILIVYRVVYVVASVIFGIAVGRVLYHQLERVGERLSAMSARDRIFLIAGVFIGLILSAIISLPIIFTISEKLIAVSLSALLGVMVTYLSTVAALSLKEEIRFYIPPEQKEETPQVPPERYKILDTNVIIDGRILDITRAGFVDGHIYIPGFVLDELQYIADSAEDLKRVRGRRGLETLKQLQKEFVLTVREYDKLATSSGPVDSKLVKLAKALNGSIITNDFNLNKVASLEGVAVLNVNELALALRPVVLPGEELEVHLVKEGNQAGQGVGYLDDGTMIVVEGGRRHLGETHVVLVSSLTQTEKGKMIFAHLVEEEDESALNGNGTYDRDRRGMRPITSRRPGRPVRPGGE